MYYLIIPGYLNLKRNDTIITIKFKLKFLEMISNTMRDADSKDLRGEAKDALHSDFKSAVDEKLS